MIFLTLMEALPGKAVELPGFLRRIKSVAPPPGVKLLGVYLLFGRYDGAILFEAPDVKIATNFILKVVSPAVCRTETFAASPAEEL